MLKGFCKSWLWQRAREEKNAINRQSAKQSPCNMQSQESNIPPNCQSSMLLSHPLFSGFDVKSTITSIANERNKLHLTEIYRNNEKKHNEHLMECYIEADGKELEVTDEPPASITEFKKGIAAVYDKVRF